MNYEVILSLISLIALENVLDIDNEIFITLITDKLTGSRRKLARISGVIMAAAFRIGLLFLITLFLGTETDLFVVQDHTITIKGLILICGGLFLIFSSTREIYRKMEFKKTQKVENTSTVSFYKVLFQILVMNLVFSMEAIITAVGVAQETWVMYAGVLIGVILMLSASANISRFLSAHPSLKVLAFCFLFIIGFTLICEGMGVEIPKGFIYFTMLFTVSLDFIYMKLNNKKIKPASKS
ncbi:MAG: TerC family protein [Bacteroidetes bacterium]|nr:TerC family protein [Bacteroidota bacterium]